MRKFCAALFLTTVLCAVGAAAEEVDVTVTMYAWDGRTVEVSPEEVPTYKNACWFTAPPVVMFDSAGAAVLISGDEADAYEAAGWTFDPPVTLYAADGGTVVVRAEDVETYKADGWFTAPPVQLYANLGRSITVSGDEVEIYKAQGWFTAVPVRLYSADGRSVMVSGDEVGEWAEGGWDTEAPKYRNKLAVFLYHSVREKPLDADSGGMCVRPDEFEHQLDFLSVSKSTSVFADELDSLDFNRGTYFALTFDDGYDDNYYVVFPLLKKYGLKATVFVVGELIGTPNYLTAEQIKEMSDSGFVSIQSHTMSHLPLGSKGLTPEETDYELGESKRLLEELTGRPVTALAYPNASFDEETARAAERYYEYAFSSASYGPYNADDRMHISRMYIGRDTAFDAFKYFFESHCGGGALHVNGLKALQEMV